MRTDLPALIVGCGPSAVHVPRLPDQYTVHAVNDAIRLCEHVDTLAINDTPVLMRRTYAELQETDTLLLPEYLHDSIVPPMLTTPAEAAIGMLMTTFGITRPAGWRLRTYRLHTDPVVKAGHAKATFGRCRSTSDSLIAWLLEQGVRTFLTNGIEWDGRHGWAEGLPPGMPKAPAHRRQIWEHTLKRIEYAGATVAQWAP